MDCQVEGVTERIVSSLRPRQVILFGSQAQASAESTSDIDLLICLDNHHPLAHSSHRDRASEILNLFRFRSFGLDVIVLTQSEMQELKDTNEGEWDLVLEILERGKVLYERRGPLPAE